MAANSNLFKPLKIGNMTLSNRLIMAPLTRFRADKDHVPHLPMVADYYAQRASVPGTLLITEATFISPKASGYPNVPTLASPEALKAWKVVTDAVHAKGSYIYAQLWALGRAAYPSVLEKEPGNIGLISSSPTPMSDNSPTPRELTVDEIKSFVSDYAQAAKNAIDAGFDGVEIHGANGYLIDQFTQDTCNKRTDSYGGSVENRARFGLEVAKAVVDAVGKERVGIRLSPWSSFQAMRMEDPIPQFKYIIQGLKDLGLTYLHLVESRVSGNADIESSDRLDPFIDVWSKNGAPGPLLIAGGFRPESAKRAVDEEYTDKEVGIVFGRYFISNPDLVFRIKKGIELTKYNRDTFYQPEKTEGYIDYPFAPEWNEDEAARL